MIKYIPILFVFLIACNHQVETTEYPSHTEREFVPYPEKYEYDGYDSTKISFKPDTSIGIISLLNPTNIEEYLGKDPMTRLTEPEDDFPNLVILSNDHNQLLKVVFHYGGIKNQFAEFKVHYNNTTDRSLYSCKDDEFVTESNIKLGMTVGFLRAIKGEPISHTIKNDQVTYHYKIDNFNESAFLQQYNLPEYFADYTFENGYLIGFHFGFVYP